MKDGEVCEYPQWAKIFLTNKIFLIEVMYRYVRMVVVKCVTITLFFIACGAL